MLSFPQAAHRERQRQRLTPAVYEKPIPPRFVSQTARASSRASASPSFPLRSSDGRRRGESNPGEVVVMIACVGRKGKLELVNICFSNLLFFFSCLLFIHPRSTGPTLLHYQKLSRNRPALAPLPLLLRIVHRLTPRWMERFHCTHSSAVGGSSSAPAVFSTPPPPGLLLCACM